MLSFPGGSDGKESAYNVGDLGSIAELWTSPGGGHDNSLQYACLENPHGQRRLVGCSPWGCEQLDTTEQLSTAIHWASFHVLICCHLLSCVFSYVKYLLKSLVCFLSCKKSGYNSFIIYMLTDIFFQSVVCLFIFLIVSFRVEVVRFEEVHIIIFFLLWFVLLCPI